MPYLKNIALFAIVSCSLCLALPSAARADIVTLDFDELAAGSTLSDEYLALGVVFSNSAGPLTVQADPLGPPFTGPNSILPFNFTAAGNFNQATFFVPVSQVSVTMGDFGGEADVLHLELYNSSDALLASEVVVLSAFINGGLTLKPRRRTWPTQGSTVWGWRATAFTSTTSLTPSFLSRRPCSCSAAD